jgi:hypothetical protein
MILAFYRTIDIVNVFVHLIISWTLKFSSLVWSSLQKHRNLDQNCNKRIPRPGLRFIFHPLLKCQGSLASTIGLIINLQHILKNLIFSSELCNLFCNPSCSAITLTKWPTIGRIKVIDPWYRVMFPKRLPGFGKDLSAKDSLTWNIWQ